MSKLHDFMLIIKSVRNWWDILAVRVGFKSKVVLRYRNGFRFSYEKGQMWNHVRLATAVHSGVDVQLMNNNYISFSVGGVTFQKALDDQGLYFLYFVTKLFLGGAKFVDDNTVLLPHGLRFKFSNQDPSTLSHIYEAFFEEAYRLLDVNNKTVLDVGASIGDTAIYFASKGALRVYAYEPNKEIFSYLLENVKINNMEDKVVPLNIAIASKQGKMCLLPETWSGRSHVSREKDEHGYWVDAELLPLNADILKMDCEGCEYDVLLNMSPGSMRFQEIMLEFHGDCRALIRTMLQEGYTTKIVKNYNSKLGLIHAKLNK
jgi:FkbM family methyltransferase